MTPPLSPPLEVHHPVSTHHKPHEIDTSLLSAGTPFTHRGGEPTVRTLDAEEKGCVRSEMCGGCGGSGGDGRGGGVVAAAPTQGSQQHIDSGATAGSEHTAPRPQSIGSVDTVEERVSDNSREASSYVWRVLVYLAFVNPLLCLLCSLYATLVLLAALIAYPIRSFILPKNRTFSITSGLSYLLLMHMRLIYPQSPSPPYLNLPLSEDFDPVRLILAHLFSPFLAGIIATASWALIFVWIYTEVLLGEKNDGHGAEYRSVMFVKQRWEEYILTALKPKSLDGY